MDPYFINALMEHWYTSLVTLRDPASIPMYFPTRGTLGWSHGLILYAPFYCVFRPFLDPFPAWTMALYAVMVTGTSCSYLVLRWLGLTFLQAIVLAAFFATSPNVVNPFTSHFSQTASVFLIPIIGVVGMSALRLSTPAAGLAAALSAFLLVLLFVQEFYTAVFLFVVTALLAAGIVAWTSLARFASQGVSDGARAFLAAAGSGRPHLAWAVVAVITAALAVAIAMHPLDRLRVGPLSMSARDPWRPAWIAALAGGWYAWSRWALTARFGRLFASLRSSTSKWLMHARRILPGRAIATRRGVVAAAFVGALLGSAVFLWIYLESFLTFRTFPEEQLFNQLRVVQSVRWTRPLEVWRALFRYDSARSVGLLAGFAVLTWLPVFRDQRAFRRVGLWSLVVAGVVAAVAVRFGDFALWKVVFGWMPGLAIIRDPSRIIYVFDLAVPVLIGGLVGRSSRPAFRRTVLFLAVVLIVADWNDRVFTFHRSREDFARIVQAPIGVDRSCRSFFIKGASREYESRHPNSNLWALYAVDSTFIALKYGIPTLNGYSAWQPDGWGLQEPHQPWYMDGVDRWIVQHRLTNVCQLDIEKRMMTRYAPTVAPSSR